MWYAYVCDIMTWRDPLHMSERERERERKKEEERGLFCFCFFYIRVSSTQRTWVASSSRAPIPCRWYVKTACRLACGGDPHLVPCSVSCFNGRLVIVNGFAVCVCLSPLSMCVSHYYLFKCIINNAAPPKKRCIMKCPNCPWFFYLRSFEACNSLLSTVEIENWELKKAVFNFNN